MKKIINFTVLFLVITSVIQAQKLAPFHRGANFSSWFETNGAQQIQFNMFTQQDFKNVKSLGFDVIRLPIRLHYMTNGAPNYTLDPLFLQFLDSAVTWATQNNIYLILDNHTFDPAVNTDPQVGKILRKVWVQMAQKYVNSGSNILYEILNEPHGISDAAWNTIQQSVIDTIRTVDSVHTIVVGGAGWNGYNNLQYLSHYADTNLIYTFHFYDPFLFTHQGASWASPSLAPLSGVPFPYDAAKMPAVPTVLKGTWVEGSLTQSYSTDGTAEHVKSLLDIAIQFGKDRNVPIYCGEFGVFNINSDPQQRVNWYDTVRTYLEQNNVPWTMWDYHGGFGIFNKNSRENFDNDLNILLVNALNLQVPIQIPYIQLADSIGFPIYSDYIGKGFVDASWLPISVLKYYVGDKPNNGNYCMKFSNASQYQAVNFSCNPVKDLSTLVAQDYAIDFMMRADSNAVSFDIRFEDADTNNTDSHPWRMKYTISPSNVEYNNTWQHIHIPLSDFAEQGAWDIANNAWFGPQGLFSWSNVACFKITAENFDFGNTNIWFDNIYITNQDTATVYEKGVFYEELLPNSVMQVIQKPEISIISNTLISITSSKPVFVKVCDVVGRTYFYNPHIEQTTLDISNLPHGMFIIQAGTSSQIILH
jgi:endoglucanase